MMTLDDPSQVEDLASRFEERAEHLSRQELEAWTSHTAKDRKTIRELMGPGAKLLVGPRGSGKSTLLRTAYFRLLDDGEVLPAYVNYAKSLALEPLFHQQANALLIFRQWILMKIVEGVVEALQEQHAGVPFDLRELAERAPFFIQDLEKGIISEHDRDLLAPSQLVDLLTKCCDRLGRNRVVLLLDDAAHAFSPEQQREFFEIFRQLRSYRVAGKAAVYPGITSYSPFLHIGQDVKKLEAWHRPDMDEFLDDMHGLLQKRLPELATHLDRHRNLVDLLALASFGLPRGFLNMIYHLVGTAEDELARPTRKRALKAIEEQALSVMSTFEALSDKLPRFKHFVDIGGELRRAFVDSLKGYNREKALTKKAAVVAVEEPIGSELGRILNLLEYAGVVRDAGTHSRGVKGVYRRYMLNYSFIIEDKALNLGRSNAVADMVAALKTPPPKAYPRVKGPALLGEDFLERCTLDLSPCSKCGTPRVSAEQRFCMKCGNQFTDASVYDELLHAPIDRLPLTLNKVEGIRQYTELRTIQDILLDDERQQLREVPHIGRIWTARIQNYAQEFVSV